MYRILLSSSTKKHVEPSYVIRFLLSARAKFVELAINHNFHKKISSIRPLMKPDISVKGLAVGKFFFNKVIDHNLSELSPSDEK